MLVYTLLPILVFYGLVLQRLTIKKNFYNLQTERYTSQKKNTLMFCFLLLWLLAVFKGLTVGTDASMYYQFFKSENYEIFEPGISFIYNIANKYNNYILFSFIVYLIFLFFISKGIEKNCPNYLISILFFILTYVYLTSFNQVRQLIAVSLIFCFINFLLSKKDRYKFVVIILIALLFHRSAIFLFLLFLVPKSKFNIKYIIPFFILTIILYFISDFKDFVGKFIINFSGFYAEKYEVNTKHFFSVNKEKGIVELMPVIFQMGILVFTHFYLDAKKNLNINYHLFYFSYNIITINLCLYAIAGIEAVDRIQLYLFVFNIYFYSLLFHQLLNDTNKYMVRLVPFLILLFWLVYYFLRILTNNQGIVPYTFLN